MTTPKLNPIDAYIAGFPNDVQTILQQVRATIREATPEAEETIKYAMPTFTLNGSNLVHCSGFINHIGFCSMHGGTDAFTKELSVYKQGTDSIQFPLDQPIPLKLIKKIVQIRVRQSAELVKQNTSASKRSWATARGTSLLCNHIHQRTTGVFMPPRIKV